MNTIERIQPIHRRQPPRSVDVYEIDGATASNEFLCASCAEQSHDDGRPAVWIDSAPANTLCHVCEVSN